MLRLHHRRVWLSLGAACALLLAGAGIVTATNVSPAEWAIFSLLCVGLFAFGCAGWLVSYRHRRENLQLRRALVAAKDAAATSALRDPDTGLGNYRLFDISMRGAFARAQRYGHPFSVLLIEVTIPEPARGVPRGLARERVLKFVGTALQGRVREADVAARLGDSMFGIVLTETEYEGAKVAWDRLREATLRHWPELRTWSLAGGASGYGVDTGSTESMLADADRRLALEKRRLRAEPET